MLGLRVVEKTKRDEAIDNGLLINVSDMARKAGIVYPIAMEVDAYEKAVMWERDDSRRKGLNGDQETRLWQVLMMCRRAINTENGKAGEVFKFSTFVVPRHGNTVDVVRVELKASIDSEGTVMTIALNKES